MRWIALFDETPRMADVRRRLEPDHFAYLRAHAGEIVIAGGLRGGPDGPVVGGLWVFEVGSRERVVQLIEADPYYRAEPRPYRLAVWGKALPDLAVTL
ncbi:MAG: YciI family protein [Burkholderiales bacterium]